MTDQERHEPQNGEVRRVEYRWLKETISDINDTVDSIKADVINLRILIGKVEQYETRITALENKFDSLTRETVQNSEARLRQVSLEETVEDNSRNIASIQGKAVGLAIAGTIILNIVFLILQRIFVK